MANESLPFEVVGGSPIVLRVRARDGSFLIVRVATAVIDVASPVLPAPILPVGPLGQPFIQVQAQLVIDVRPESA